jgi:hypothetical protein
MATVIRDFKVLPKVTVLVPGRKPPVLSFPYQDRESPYEADEFLAFIRELRRDSPASPPKPFRPATGLWVVDSAHSASTISPNQ